MTRSPEELSFLLGDLVHRYAALADQRRTVELSALFVQHGQLLLPTPPERLDPHLELVGRDAIVAHMAVLDELDLTSHQLVGEVFDLDDDVPDGSRATGRVACVAHHVVGERDVVWHLHYDDTYTIEEGEWRFLRRELHLDFIQSQRASVHR